MKDKGTESMSSAHSAALGLLVKFKNLSVGDKKAEQERAVDQRFIFAVTELLKTRKEEDAMSWLLMPCRCLDCINMANPEVKNQLPRIDMLNAEVSFQHLMKQIECEGYCLP